MSKSCHNSFWSVVKLVEHKMKCTEIRLTFYPIASARKVLCTCEGWPILKICFFFASGPQQGLSGDTLLWTFSWFSCCLSAVETKLQVMGNRRSYSWIKTEHFRRIGFCEVREEMWLDAVDNQQVVVERASVEAGQIHVFVLSEKPLSSVVIALMHWMQRQLDTFVFLCAWKVKLQCSTRISLCGQRRL